MKDGVLKNDFGAPPPEVLYPLLIVQFGFFCLSYGIYEYTLGGVVHLQGIIVNHCAASLIDYEGVISIQSCLVTIVPTSGPYSHGVSCG